VTTEEKPTPQLIAALRDVVQERGWTFVGESNGVYTVELLGVSTDPVVSTASPDGLVRAIDAWHARRDATKEGHLIGAPRTIIVGVVEKEDLA
jgi:hypothetical protein